MIPTCKITELTLEDAKGYMRIEYDYDDTYINFYLNSAQSYIQNMLKLKFEDFGEDLPQELTLPCLALCQHWYSKKGIEEDSTSRMITHNLTEIIDLHRSYLGET